ncbi:EAL domain-containing protein [uncultured Williamsia sp.]|uniref:EAL domain-containing protein n=1 Tax=uncultured Williamsia sp. TaxID=259311 RepID=UPI0026309692|nr:EAL domain-containing protein [uncultured Williamsia sp.]
MVTRPETPGSLLSALSDADVARVVGDIAPGKLAAVAVKMEASDRIAAAFGRATGLAARQATLVAVADLVGDQGIVFAGAADLGVVVVDVDLVDPQRIVADVARRLASTIAVDGVDYFVQTHMGVALPGDAHGRDVRDVLQAAIAAVHHATTSGSHLAWASDISISHLREEIELAAELANAVGEAFTLHYQPIVRMDTLEVVGYESLLRWTVDDRVRLPGEFLDAAEETSLIVPIGRWGVVEAIRQLGAWQRLVGDDELFVSVNFSSQQLVDHALTGHIADALTRAGVLAASLWIEVTERDLITSDSPAAQTIRELADLGCVIAVDDLGTGYAALRYMVDQPVSVAKIDRSLIQGVDGGVSRSIVETVCRLADDLGIRSVAEGVEDGAVVDVLREIGFTHAQGYLFGRPQPAADIVPPGA